MSDIAVHSGLLNGFRVFATHKVSRPFFYRQLQKQYKVFQKPWSCSYGCWIYNYLCNQCLSLL